MVYYCLPSLRPSPLFSFSNFLMGFFFLQRQVGSNDYLRERLLLINEKFIIKQEISQRQQSSYLTKGFQKLKQNT